MAVFGTQQVLQWLAIVPGLTEQQLDAIGRKLDEAEYDGEELAEVKEKTLRRLLKDTGAADCVPAILTARDAYLVTNDSNQTEADQQEASSSEVRSCSICFEPYGAGVGLGWPRLRACAATRRVLGGSPPPRHAGLLGE